MLRNDFSTNVRRRRNDSATDADDSSRPCRVNQRLQHYNLLLPRRAVKRKKNDYQFRGTECFYEKIENRLFFINKQRLRMSTSYIGIKEIHIFATKIVRKRKDCEKSETLIIFVIFSIICEKFHQQGE